MQFFINLWLCWVFDAAWAFLSLGWAGATLELRCMGFSLWWLLVFRSTGSRPVGFNSCGTQAQYLELEGPQVLRLQELWPVGSTVQGQ